VTEIAEFSPEWRRFEDWLAKHFGKRHDWTIVAQFDSASSSDGALARDSHATFSYMIDNTKEAFEKNFDTDTWYEQPSFGTGFTSNENEGLRYYSDDGNEGRYIFVTLVDGIADFPSYWSLWPPFVHYSRLREKPKGILVDPCSGDDVVRFPKSVDSGPVEIRTDYLQEYLAARGCILVRQHDYRRACEQRSPVANQFSDTGLIATESGVNRLIVRDDLAQPFSWLTAKDCVIPFGKAGTVGVHRVRPNPFDLPDFITGVDIHGNQTLQKPNAGALFPQVFFKPRVLKRYYDEPSKYTVWFGSPGMGQISALQWSISIGRNEEGLVCLWLGDLAKQGLPLEEVAYWRAHNVPPRGGVAGEFFEAQMMCRFTGSVSLEERLRGSRRALEHCASEKGLSLYLPFNGTDRYLEKQLRIPLEEESTEFEQAVIVLAKLMIDHLDESSMRKSLQEDNPDLTLPRPGMSMQVFESWLLHCLSVDKGIAFIVRGALQFVQDLRSKCGGAHRLSKTELDKMKSKYGPTYAAIFTGIAEELAGAFEDVCRSIGADPRKLYQQLW
jgi:hypothetical protein